MTKAGVECRGLSAIMIEVDDAHFGMVACKLVEEAAAAVGAPIIDVDDFKRRNLAVQSLQRLRGQGVQVIAFIEDGNHDREMWRHIVSRHGFVEGIKSDPPIQVKKSSANLIASYNLNEWMSG